MGPSIILQFIWIEISMHELVILLVGVFVNSVHICRQSWTKMFLLRSHAGTGSILELYELSWCTWGCTQRST